MRNVHTYYGLSVLIVFKFEARTGQTVDRRTDRRTSKTRNAANGTYAIFSEDNHNHNHHVLICFYLL